MFPEFYREMMSLILVLSEKKSFFLNFWVFEDSLENIDIWYSEVMVDEVLNKVSYSFIFFFFFCSLLSCLLQHVKCLHDLSRGNANITRSTENVWETWEVHKACCGCHQRILLRRRTWGTHFFQSQRDTGQLIVGIHQLQTFRPLFCLKKSSWGQVNFFWVIKLLDRFLVLVSWHWASKLE